MALHKGALPGGGQLQSCAAPFYTSISVLVPTGITPDYLKEQPEAARRAGSLLFRDKS